MPSATALEPLQRKRFASRLGMTLIETTIVVMIVAAGVSGTVTAGAATVSNRVTASNFKTAGAFIDPAHNEVAAASVRTNNWFRSYGDTGWYNETYGGGWYMSDGTWLRAYSNKSIYTGGLIQADGGMVTSHVDAGSVVSKHYAPEGWGCTPGSIGQYENSTMLCVNGVWRKGGGAFPTCDGYAVGTVVHLGFWDRGYQYKACNANGDWIAFATWPN